MGLRTGAKPPAGPVNRARRLRALLACAGTMVAATAFGAAPAAADAGKVLVFTGTAGAQNPATATGASAIQALGAANDFTVDVTADAAQINAANLANYRAVVFVNSSGDVLNADQESALQSYVEGGGGFVGVGETAKLEEGGASFFNTLIGLTGATRTGAASDNSAQDVEFLDRVHPATKSLPPLVKGHADSYYTWTNNPTGSVHTVARVRFNDIPGAEPGTRESVTNDAIQRLTGTTNTLQPQLQRALSWCRDVQQGRSFYTGMGRTVDAYAGTTLRAHLLGAIQWASGMTRGNCKATITSNYRTVRLTPPNPAQTNNYVGEIDALAMADDGRVFYAGRAVCFQGQTQMTNWTQANTGLGCGPIHVWDPRVAGDDNQNPAKITKIADFPVAGAKGGGSETGATAKMEQGILGIALDPDFTKGRPYIYVAYHPYWGGKGGFNTDPIGPGFVKSDYIAERRLSRFTYNEATKQVDVDSEIIIHRWMTQVFSCCHLGGSMDWDSQGNLYFATGDNTGNSPNSTNGGYTNSHPNYTIPCPNGAINPNTGSIATYVGTGCAVDTNNPNRPACAADDGIGARTKCARNEYGWGLSAPTIISYSDARQTSGNTNTFEGKLLRIKPLPNPDPNEQGIGKTYTIPGADAPNGPNLFPPNSQAVQDGKAKPEIFAMGVRNLYSISVDKHGTDKVAAAWVGPDQGTNSTTWGPAKTENAVIIGSAGNYGWPFCTGNNQGYRAKLPASSGGGTAAPFGHPGTVGGGADGQTGGYWDCDDPQGILNDSPYNDGLERIPAARPTNIWYGPQGGCYDFPLNANGIHVVPANSNTTNEAGGSYRRCPWLIGGSQAPMTGGFYRKPAGDHPNAWPEYWEGRWFLSDYAGANNIRHALLMDPATEFTGGQPLAVDSLYPIIPTSLMGGNRTIDLDWDAEGRLVIADYGGSNFQISNNNTAVRRFEYIGGPDTPGPDPKAYPSANSSQVTFDKGNSGGVSYKWTFDDGATAEGATVTHAFLTGGHHSATLEVTYADGEKASEEVTFEVAHSVSTSVSAHVDEVLALTLGAPASFGTFVPAVANTYSADTTANVVSTMSNAALTILDPSSVSPGHLVNSGTPLPQPLQVRATNAANPDTSFAAISGNPLTLLTYPGPISNDAVSVQFRQPIAANDALKAGSYSKTLTFTLSSTQP
jgi:type 1 glutamine amidotransferase